MTANPELKIFLSFPPFIADEIYCSSSEMDDSLVSMNTMSITWGRDAYLSHQEPAVLKLDVYDRSGIIATRAKNRQLIGWPIACWCGYWSQTPGTPDTWKIFVGRITAGEANPARTLAGQKSGATEWIVTLTAVSREAQLGDVYYGDNSVAWPRETQTTRRNRITSGQISVGITQFNFFSGGGAIQCAPYDPSGKSVMDVMREFYIGQGDTYSYQPDTNNVSALFRRSDAAGVSGADVEIRQVAFLNSAHPRWLEIKPAARTVDGVATAGTAIPGCYVTAMSGITLEPNVAVTRCEISFKDFNNAYADTTVGVNDANNDSQGRRTVRFETMQDTNASPNFLVQAVATETVNRMVKEGKTPRHPDVMYPATRLGGFLSRDSARQLLYGAEEQGLIYLSGSPFQDFMLDEPPVYAIIGGQINYDGTNGWEIAYHFQQYDVSGTNSTSDEDAWSTMNTSILWGQQATAPNFNYGASVTWRDVKFVKDLGAIFTNST